ncbi:MAG: chemotaxis protein [Lachnospiraceae bacterium]
MTANEETIAGLKEIVLVIRDRQTREVVESTIRRLDAIPEPECRRFIADTKQRFIQKRDNSIRCRLAKAKAQARTEKPHPKRKEPDRERL